MQIYDTFKDIAYWIGLFVIFKHVGSALNYVWDEYQKWRNPISENRITKRFDKPGLFRLWIEMYRSRDPEHSLPRVPGILKDARACLHYWEDEYPKHRFKKNEEGIAQEIPLVLDVVVEEQTGRPLWIERFIEVHGKRHKPYSDDKMRAIKRSYFNHERDWMYE